MNSKIIWFTGLSGSGKTTLSDYLKKYLLKNNFSVLQVDGDNFRKSQKIKNIFTKKEIISNNYKIIRHVYLKRKKYSYILVSVISPLKITRKFAKKIFKENYFEIYVKCKISTLKKRDTKGLYKKADKKIINNLIGYRSKINYEKSKYKIITIDTDKLKLQEAKKKILKYIN